MFEYEYLHELFDEIGCASQGLNGAISISWSDLFAWHRISGYGCTSWDLSALKKMSQACASTSNLSSKQDYVAPYVEELKFPAFPYATIRNNALIKEFCSGLPGLGQKVTKSLSSAA